MEFTLFSRRVNAFVLLLALSSSCKFIQGPMDFGPLNFLHTTNSAAQDFGKIIFNSPSAVLRPKSPREISQLLKYLSASFSKVTVAAKGAGHSIHGQAQALNGIVIEMESLPSSIIIHQEQEVGASYVDVSAGTLWVDLLKECLKVGLAPRSWTDYLYLSIGGTLSNAGISGQTFKYGPQISNVLQLDVVTVGGEVMTCSPTQRSDLFYAVLGGLGQFGIITSARILLQEAPEKVKWVRAFYDDFDVFTKDQELLVSMKEVDYVEGFLVLNKLSLHSSTIAFPATLDFDPPFHAGNRPLVYFCIEFAVHYPRVKESDVDQIVEVIAEQLSFIPSQIYDVDISYFDFLDRVRMEEDSLRSIGLWEVPHPWLNMFVPKSGIIRFKDLLLDNISSSTFQGPILIYPLLRDKWDSNMSAVLPESAGAEQEEVVYIVGMLQSAGPAICRTPGCLDELVRQNEQIAKAAAGAAIGAKQYLAYHGGEQGWRQHFGGKWDRFKARKFKYDPMAILGPGQGIFERRYSSGAHLGPLSREAIQNV